MAQEAQDLFQSELKDASLLQDTSKVQQLISAHRLWVKPVVNDLISDYIHRTMTGNRGAARKNKEAANLIAHTFQDMYGERSLYTATSYLDSWTLEQLGKKAQADRMYDKATRLRLGGQAEEAMASFGSALELYKDIGDVRGQGEVLGGMGAIYWYIDSDTCLMFYQEALEARREADDRVLTGNSLNGIGLVYLSHYIDFIRAINYFTQAIEIRKEIGQVDQLGKSVAYLAQSYQNVGELELARVHFDQSYLLNRETGDSLKMGESKLHSGEILLGTGRYPEAIKDLRMSLAVFTGIQDSVNLGNVYLQIGLVFERMGDYDRALEILDSASLCYAAMDYSWGLAGVYNHTGMVLQSAGRPGRAIERYQRSLEIFESLDDKRNMVIQYTNIGSANFETGNFKGAEAFQLKGLELAGEINFREGELPCLINLANAQNRLGLLDEAAKNYALAMDLCKELDSPDNEWKVMVGMAENHTLRGAYEKAIEYNEKGLRIIEDLRSTLPEEEYRSSYMARERFAFEDVIHLLANLHESDSGKGFDLLAFEYAQRCKSRSFLDRMEQTEPIGLKDIQGSGLEKNTVLLEYSLGDSSSCLWVITRDVYKMIRLPDRETLRQQVETLRFAIQSPERENQSFLEASGSFLYNQLIQPAEAYLSRKDHLVILPDGILHYVPFEVLISRKPDPGSETPLEQLSFLGKTHPVSYGQSSSVLVGMMGSKTRANIPELRYLVAVGDPEYSNSYKRLTYSGDEIRGIASLFPPASSEIILREEASESRIKRKGFLSGFRYIHFATHGIMDEKKPGQSSLVLTQPDTSGEDGFLRAEEIAAMELNADLAVLSACQTGLGKLIQGEGMIGLSRSFMYAGSPSVVVSLWEVSDQSTNNLMGRFYENLFKKGKSKVEALYQARKSMIREKQYAHPFFWAPFVLHGDWL